MLRPGTLLTLRIEGTDYSLLFLHTKSSPGPVGFGIRNDQFSRAIGFKKGPQRLRVPRDGRASPLVRRQGRLRRRAHDVTWSNGRRVQALLAQQRPDLAGLCSGRPAPEMARLYAAVNARRLATSGSGLTALRGGRRRGVATPVALRAPSVASPAPMDPVLFTCSLRGCESIGNRQ